MTANQSALATNVTNLDPCKRKKKIIRVNRENVFPAGIKRGFVLAKYVEVHDIR